jgi:hypothetical protein
MFGNSFVQAPGMLADTARARLPDRRIFNLGRNELLPLRFAQARLLLDRGLAPERLFFNLMPVDAIQLARQPLDTYRVNARGAITYDVPAGGPTGWLARHTRLGLTAWARTRRDASRDGTVSQKLHDRVDPELLADLKRLFVALAADARRHRVPVTVMLLPTHQQVTKGASFAFQDALGACLRQAGLDVFDPRQAFCDHPDRAGLFLPDKHFNEAGNAVLLAELLRHLGRGGPVATRVP